MDLNYYLRRHQISLMRASVAACDPSRRSHEGLASGYADAVTTFQQRAGGSLALRPLLSAGGAR